jgi:hypothetical protein
MTDFFGSRDLGGARAEQEREKMEFKEGDMVRLKGKSFNQELKWMEGIVTSVGSDGDNPGDIVEVEITKSNNKELIGNIIRELKSRLEIVEE